MEKKNKLKVSIGIIIIVVIIVGFLGWSIYSKSENTKKDKAFTQNFQEAENVNISANSKLVNLLDGYLQQANTLAGNTIGKFTDVNYQTNYGKIELSNIFAERFIELNSQLQNDIVKNSNGNVEIALNNQKKIWESYLTNQDNAIKGQKETVRLQNEANNYLSLTENVLYFNIYNYLGNNGINPQFNSNYLDNQLASIGNNSVKDELTVNQKDYINKADSSMNYIEIQSNNIINTAIENKTSIIVAYKQIDELWNKYLNEEYSQLKTISPYKESVINGEKPWTTFRDAMCKEASNEYKNPTESELASLKMNIRLTEQQAFNLLSYA